MARYQSPRLQGTFWLTYSMPGWQVGDPYENCGSGLLKSTNGKPEGPYVDVSPNERLSDEIDASLFEDSETPTCKTACAGEEPRNSTG